MSDMPAQVHDPDNPPPSGPFTHWVDTNVMLEVYSHGDLYQAFEHWQRECRADGLVLVTRDAEVLEEAQNAGVDAADPEVFAVRHLARDEARRIFAQRLDDAVIRYVVTGPPPEQDMRIRVGRTVREVYGHIWQPANQPVFMDPAIPRTP